jgi:hypothetical protein
VPISIQGPLKCAPRLPISSCVSGTQADEFIQLRDKITKIVATLKEGKLLTRRLTWCFEFRPASPTTVAEDTPEESHTVPVYRGASRVLEIGCSDGSWCFRFKKEQPSWIVEGIDDTDQ